MQVSVEKISNIECKLHIQVPAEKVESLFNQKIKDFAKKANIKGFRPGKAPISYVQQRFGEDARMEAMGEIMRDALHKALNDQKLQPVSQPIVKPEEISPGQPFKFEATFEVLPEIEKVNFNLDNIDTLKVDITDGDIDYVINQLRKQFTQWNPVERASKVGDRLVIDSVSKMEGETEEGKANDMTVEIGAQAMLPGYDDELTNVKAGDVKTFSVTLPQDDDKNKDISGKKVDFTIIVKKVVEAHSQEMNEDLIKKLGVESGDIQDLNKQIRTSLEQERDRLVKNKLKEKVFNQLIADNKIEVPKSLVEQEAKNIHDEVYPQHKNEQNHHHSAEELAQFKQVAEQRVAVGLLIAAYAKSHQIKVSDELVKARVKEIASVYENPNEVEAWLSSGDQVGNIESQVLEDQILEELTKNITKHEKTMTYAELKGFRI